MPFKPGQSGNPLGKPKVPEEVMAMWSKLVPEAIKAVQACLASDDLELRLKAANVVLDRKFGKPAQSVEATGEISLIGIKLRK